MLLTFTESENGTSEAREVKGDWLLATTMSSRDLAAACCASILVVPLTSVLPAIEFDTSTTTATSRLRLRT